MPSAARRANMAPRRACSALVVQVLFGHRPGLAGQLRLPGAEVPGLAPDELLLAQLGDACLAFDGEGAQALPAAVALAVQKPGFGGIGSLGLSLAGPSGRAG